MLAGVVDRVRGAAGQLLGQLEIGVRVAAPRRRRHQREHAQRLPARHEGHGQRALCPERPDERGELRQDVFQYEGGIRSFVEHLAAVKTPLHPKVIAMSGVQSGITVDVALQWTDA